MAFTSRIPCYTIDLTKPEEDRWQHVIAKEKRTAKRLSREIRKHWPSVATGLLKYPFRVLYRASGGRFTAESDSWAEALGECPAESLLAQCSYELAHTGAWLGSLFGCTAGIRWVPGVGMVHVRNMDWPVSCLGEATRLFGFRHGRRQFVSLGVLGFVGVLSGMLPKRYSVTMNWAPPTSRPTFDFGPSFLIREVLETCDTYDEAVAVLKHTHLSTSVFFVVCGTKKNQGCVIERTHREAGVRRLRDDGLSKANHFELRRFARFNDGVDLEYSMERQESLAEQLRQVRGGADVCEIAACLDAEPVLNEDTCQQMVFCPTRGTTAAWRLL